jgi:hypothetical protein
VPFTPSTANAARALNVHLQETSRGSLSLCYVLDADLSSLRIPAIRAARQTDELWEHTCFEAFIRKTADSPAYYELNVSPSTERALYSFDDYHQNMKPVTPPQPPRISVTREANRLAAVIEDADGELEYWALNHVSSTPDFHHRESFIIPA